MWVIIRPNKTSEREFLVPQLTMAYLKRYEKIGLFLFVQLARRRPTGLVQAIIGTADSSDL
jgi:hypothetical protein